MSVAFEKCAATVTVLAMLLFAPPAYPQAQSNAGGGPQSSPGESQADKDLAQRVYSRLSADSKDYYKHVTVSSANGVVTLAGTVDSTEALNKAKRIAAQVDGVTKVVTQMRLEREHPNAP
jgi:hyperosmotically inducible protein